jgi:hypothetical protein
MSPIAKSRLLNIDEVADRLRISKRSAYRVAKEMRTERVGGATVVSEYELERFMAARLRGPRETRERHPLCEVLATDAMQAIDALDACCWQPGYTYIVEGAGMYKIGRVAAALDRRLAHLQAQSPVPLRLLLVSRDSDLEARLHELCRSERAHGEWFHVAAMVILRSHIASSKERGVCLACVMR